MVGSNLRWFLTTADPAREWRSLVELLFSGRAPAGLVVEGDLYLAGLRLRSLPAELTVTGNLDLRQCQRLRRIGEGLSVGGSLKIGGSLSGPIGNSTGSLFVRSVDRFAPLVALPKTLEVSGDLELRNCHELRQFPKDAKVGGSILLSGCRNLETLPDKLKVKGGLRIQGGRRLTALPRKLSTSGELSIVGTCIETLPQYLKVGGSLELRKCSRLTSLPDPLEVNGDLVISGCSLAALPSTLRVGNDVVLEKVKGLIETPSDLLVPGSLKARYCPDLERIGSGLVLGGSLSLHHCPNLEALPADLEVPGNLSLAHCGVLRHLPRGLSVGTKREGSGLGSRALDLTGCTSLEALPEDLRVIGRIEVAGSGLRRVPSQILKTASLTWRGVVVSPEVVIAPETLEAPFILSQANAELRRVMLERVGIEHVLDRAGAVVIHADTDPGGPRSLVHLKELDRTYLRCQCPSTGREYLLRVPTTMRSCHQAAAWMAGFTDPDDYRPIKET